MTKTHKIIITVAAFLIIIFILCPPYYRMERTTGVFFVSIKHSSWAFVFGKSFQVEDSDEYFRYSKIRFDILSLEIFGILVLAGAAFLISKNRK